MSHLATTRRLGSVCILLGTLLFAAATAFHPPTVSPRDVHESLLSALEPHWALDHGALLVASILLHTGLVSFSALIHARGVSGFAPYAAVSAVAALVLWLLIFTFEATGWPVIAAQLAKETARLIAAAGPVPMGEVSDLMALAEAGWRTTLATGYVAAFLLAVAVTLWGLDLVALDLFPGWFNWLGVVAGLTAALAQPIAWSVPAVSLAVLVPGAALLGVWFLAAGWFLWLRTPESEGQPDQASRAPSQDEG